MKKFLLQLATLLPLLFVCSLGLSGQADDQDRDQFSVRYLLPNYITPLSTIPPNLQGSASFGGGLEFEYQRRINPNFLLGIPFRITTADAIRNSNVNLSQPVFGQRDVTRVNAFGANLQLLFEPIARRSFFDPQLFAGIGLFTESFLKTTVEVPLGVNLNLRLDDGVYFTPQISYRLALDKDAGDIRNNLQLGAGFHLYFGESAPPKPKPPVDTDGDGTPDVTDQCPTVPGPASLLGCPDKDGDGVADKNDKCPDVAGPAAMMGCPDTDGDGITDAEDECPEEAGPANNKGCPISDRDGDGTVDADDKCPDEAGPIANNGCPIADRDGDGVADADDKCPDLAGPAALMGCPDTDGDGVPDPEDRCPDKVGPASGQGCPDTDNDTVIDPDDRCPTEFGPASNRGCPELTVEDKETIDFAIQNINFETGSDRLTPASREVLERVKDIMNRYPAYQLAIGGHTDSIGSAESNQTLSEKRAKSVLRYLTDAGVAESRMTAQGFGETQPIGDNRYAPGRELNRRVTLDLVVN